MISAPILPSLWHGQSVRVTVTIWDEANDTRLKPEGPLWISVTTGTATIRLTQAPLVFYVVGGYTPGTSEIVITGQANFGTREDPKIEEFSSFIRVENRGRRPYSMTVEWGEVEK